MIDFKQELITYQDIVALKRKLLTRSDLHTFKIYHKSRITALLNLYHEVRGSEHRHNPGTCAGWRLSVVEQCLRDAYEHSEPVRLFKLEDYLIVGPYPSCGWPNGSDVYPWSTKKTNE